MLVRLIQRNGNILGYKVIGLITNTDYADLTADLKALSPHEPNIRLLLDLEAFEGEDLRSPGAKLGFQAWFGQKINKLAIVGDNRWHKWLLTFSDQLNSNREMEFFPIDEHEIAWEWLMA